MSRRRQGFTLLEMLVSIGIMVVLLSIGVLGYQKIDKVVSERTTRTRLELLSSMSSEFDIVTPITSLSWINTNPFAIPAADNGTSATWGSPPVTVTVYSYNVNIGSEDRYSEHWPDNHQNMAVLNTGTLLTQFATVPAANAMLLQLPSSAIMPSNGATPNSPWIEQFNGGGTVGGSYNGMTESSPVPIVVDAWKNPIIFIPAGGMSGVWVNGVMHTVKAADGLAFWASAGQDGDFALGDDNVYSRPVIYR